MIFVAYELNLPLNMEKPHYRSQRAGEWGLIWAHDSRPIYRALTYIAVPLLGPHQPRYIGLTLYCVIFLNYSRRLNWLWIPSHALPQHYSDVIMSMMASPNHQPHDCLLNRLFRCRWKKTSKLCITALCERNSPVTGELAAQRASNAENLMTSPCYVRIYVDRSSKHYSFDWPRKNS